MPEQEGGGGGGGVGAGDDEAEGFGLDVLEVEGAAFGVDAGLEFFEQVAEKVFACEILGVVAVVDGVYCELGRVLGREH